jgi:hypothetical protein
VLALKDPGRSLPIIERKFDIEKHPVDLVQGR